MIDNRTLPIETVIAQGRLVAEDGRLLVDCPRIDWPDSVRNSVHLGKELTGGDFAVTGFDDIPEAAAAGLTTVSQPLLDKGRIAGELYLSRRPGMAPRRRVLPLHLQARQSSGPPR